MKKSTIEQIREAIREAAKFPKSAKPQIEYNFTDLPNEVGITPNSFHGVRAVFNNRIDGEKGYQVTYKL